MKAMITGMNGTVAPAIASILKETGHDVVGWDRTMVPTDHLDAVRQFIGQEQPDWFFHVATGSPDWAAWVAQVCVEEDVKFLFTSSVSVFSAKQTGPFSVDVLPEPDNDYGRYKFECEQHVQQANPDAIIARLGWQIGTSVGGNHMLDYLSRTFAAEGEIDASTAWFPACSFLPDTAVALVSLITTFPPGLYHVEGNPGLNFYEIVTGLKQLQQTSWKIKPTTAHQQNNRMIDGRIQIKPITNYLTPLSTKLSIPQSETEITAEWLQQALAQSFAKATFTSLTHEQIGEDFGFASRIFRYQWRENDQRQSVVIKLWSTDSKAGIGEIRFYQTFSDVGARIPKCYFSGFDEETNTAVLLLEDITNATQGDVLQLLNREQANNMAVSLAKLHATWAKNRKLDAHQWLQDVTIWQPEASWFDSRRSLFLDRFENRLQGLAVPLLAQIEKTPDIVNGRLANAPQTLLHGDFHLDNVLFEKGNRPVLLDWSRPLIGPPVINLATLLFRMIPLPLFEATLAIYLDTFNQIAETPLRQTDLTYQLGAALLRQFAKATCGVALWQPTLPRAIKMIDVSLQQTNEIIEFWQARDPELFSFLS